MLQREGERAWNTEAAEDAADPLINEHKKSGRSRFKSLVVTIVIIFKTGLTYGQREFQWKTNLSKRVYRVKRFQPGT